MYAIRSYYGRARTVAVAADRGARGIVRILPGYVDHTAPLAVPGRTVTVAVRGAAVRTADIAGRDVRRVPRHRRIQRAVHMAGTWRRRMTLLARVARTTRQRAVMVGQVGRRVQTRRRVDSCRCRVGMTFSTGDRTRSLIPRFTGRGRMATQTTEVGRTVRVARNNFV